jgi:hypothetical protein
LRNLVDEMTGRGAFFVQAFREGRSQLPDAFYAGVAPVLSELAEVVPLMWDFPLEKPGNPLAAVHSPLQLAYRSDDLRRAADVAVEEVRLAVDSGGDVDLARRFCWSATWAVQDALFAKVGVPTDERLSLALRLEAGDYSIEEMKALVSAGAGGAGKFTRTVDSYRQAVVSPGQKHRGEEVRSSESVLGEARLPELPDDLVIPQIERSPGSRRASQKVDVSTMLEFKRRLVLLNDEMTAALEPFTTKLEEMLRSQDHGPCDQLGVNQEVISALNYVARRLERNFVCPKEANPTDGSSAESVPALLRCRTAQGSPEGVVGFEHRKPDDSGLINHGGFRSWAKLVLHKINPLRDKVMRRS